MKAVIVITADQVGSRRGAMPIDSTLASLRPLVSGRDSRSFAQQAGDEIQGLMLHSADAVRVVEALTRAGEWRIGVGLGEVDTPTPRDVRTATGSAFVAARRAVTEARGAPQALRVVASDPSEEAVDAEASLWLARSLWSRRTPSGWAALDAVTQARSQQEAAAVLGISPSALSQRLRAAQREEGEAARRLAARLLENARRAIEATGGADR